MPIFEGLRVCAFCRLYGSEHAARRKRLDYTVDRSVSDLYVLIKYIKLYDDSRRGRIWKGWVAIQRDFIASDVAESFTTTFVFKY